MVVCRVSLMSVIMIDVDWLYRGWGYEGMKVRGYVMMVLLQKTLKLNYINYPEKQRRTQ